MSKFSQIKEAVWEESSKMNEHNDCAVKAISLVTKKTYSEAHQALKSEGRKNRRGTYKWQQQGALLNLGFKREVIDQPKKSNGTGYTPKTIHQFCKKGHWMAYVSGHVFAIIDGEVLDWTEGRCHRIKQVWRITSINEAENISPEPEILKKKMSISVNGGPEFTKLTDALRHVGLNVQGDWRNVRNGLKKSESFEYKGHIFRRF